MKKMAVTMAVALGLTAGWCQANTVRDNCGCGLGTMLLGENEPTMIVNLAATLLNGISGNQTFGITTGTLGCDKPGSFAQNQELKRFVESNLDHLALEMAMGQGQSLDALADLVGVAAADRDSFKVKLQDKFAVIFPDDAVTAESVIQNLEQVLHS